MKNKMKFLGLSLFTLLFIQTSLAATPGFGWIKGSGNVITETRDISSFHGIDIGGAFEIILVKATKEKIVLEADDNLMPYIRTKVFGSTLEVDNEKDFRNPTTLKVTIYYTNIDQIDLSGAASLKSNDILKTESLEIDASGATDIVLKLETGKLEADFSGASKAEFIGSAKKAEVQASGATVFKGLEFETEDFEIDASGAAVARIWASGQLGIEASGASSVRYKGSPSINLISISGASSVRKY